MATKRSFEGKDAVAIVGILVNGFLIYSGHNGAVMSMMGIIIGWYFGTKK